MTAIALAALPPDLDLDAATAEWAAAHGDPAGLRAVLTELFRDVRAQPWGNYLARRDGLPVGLCAFKAPPAAGTVEIAYASFPRVERQGVGLAMAAALVELARANGVANVIAHTLPEPNASNRLLTRLGFAFAGDAVDPADGDVWRWELPLQN